MENSNIKKIPLDSNINIKSEDMLEDVNNPTFIDNPQQYQGRYLPNSLRFEHNGWAAGDRVYNFDEQNTEITDLTKTWSITKKFITDNILRLDFINKTDKELNFSINWTVSSLENDIRVAIEDDIEHTKSTVIINTDDISCSFVWDGVTLNIDSVSSDNYDVQCVFNSDTLLWDVTIVDTAAVERFDVKFEPECTLSIDNTKMSLQNVTSDSNLVFSYPTSDSIEVSKDFSEAKTSLYTDKDGEPITIQNNNNTFSFNKSENFSVNSYYGYDDIIYKYESSNLFEYSDKSIEYPEIKNYPNAMYGLEKTSTWKVNRTYSTFTKDNINYIKGYLAIPMYLAVTVRGDSQGQVLAKDVAIWHSLGKNNEEQSKYNFTQLEHSFTLHFPDDNFLNGVCIKFNAYRSDADNTWCYDSEKYYSRNDILKENIELVQDKYNSVLEYAVAFARDDEYADAVESQSCTYMLTLWIKAGFAYKQVIGTVDKYPILTELSVSEIYDVFGPFDGSRSDYDGNIFMGITSDDAKVFAASKNIGYIDNINTYVFTNEAGYYTIKFTGKTVLRNKAGRALVGSDSNITNINYHWNAMAFQYKYVKEIFLGGIGKVTPSVLAELSDDSVTAPYIKYDTEYGVLTDSYFNFEYDFLNVEITDTYNLTRCNQMSSSSFIRFNYVPSADPLIVLHDYLANLAYKDDTNIGLHIENLQLSVMSTTSKNIATVVGNGVSFKIVSLSTYDGIKYNTTYSLEDVVSDYDELSFSIAQDTGAIIIAAALDYTFVFKPYVLKDFSTDYLVSFNSATMKYSTKNGIIFDLNNLELAYKKLSFNIIKQDNTYVSNVEYTPTYKLSCQLLGLQTVSDKLTAVGYNTSTEKYKVTINNKKYTFNSILFNSISASVLEYNSRYVNKSGDDLSLIGKIDTSKELQFINQQWDATVETEKFWWVDSTHILKLTQTSLVLLYNTKEVDDWNGNKWQEVGRWGRGNFINNDFIRYDVSCANSSAALFYNLQAQNDLIYINFYDPLNNMNLVANITLTVKNINLGTKLNLSASFINTYSIATAYDLVSDSDLSCTVVGDYVLFGIHYDNNFNQWAISFNKNSPETFSVLHGYGYVGIDGSLTGGEIPSKYFDTTVGFNSIVYSIDELTLSENTVAEKDSVADFLGIPTDFKNKIYGTDAYQYYITDSISAIVSHLKWSNDSWQAIELPITNNVDQCYYSDSFGKSIKTDFNEVQQDITDLLPETIKKELTEMLTLMIENDKEAESKPPSTSDGKNNDAVFRKVQGQLRGTNTNSSFAMASVFLKLPRVTNALYLQQTAGQYAYVHYNNTDFEKIVNLSSSNNTDAMQDFIGADNYDNTLNRKDDKQSYHAKLTFARKSLSQEGLLQPIATDLESAFMSALSNLPILQRTPLIVNQLVSPSTGTNANTVSGMLTEFASDALSNATAQMNMSVGNAVRCKSTVNSLLSLDMFYSTSDRQHICAGRGYVNHNFVAQAIAQSIVSNQFEYNQFITYLLYKFKTTWPFQLMSGLGGLLKASGTAWSNFKAVGSGGAFGATFVTIGTIFKCISDAILSIYDIAFSMLGADNGEVRLLSNTSTHDLNIEAPHKYGCKSEHFMWPSFGVNKNLTYMDESVEASYKCIPWTLATQLGTFTDGSNNFTYNGATTLQYMSMAAGKQLYNKINSPEASKYTLASNSRSNASSQIKYLLNDDATQLNKAVTYIASIKGNAAERQLPDNMACIIGTDKFLPSEPFKNENIGVDDPTFTTPVIHDYMLDKYWQLGCTATDSMTLWISAGDTKIIDGDFTNIVVSNSFCGVASPYNAIEVKRGISTKYIRPTLITPEALALNNTGYNCIYQNKMYHAFDGQGYRTVEWVGGSGLNKEQRTLQYNYIVNDRFKRSNKLPPNEVLGNFLGEPTMTNKILPDDKIHIQIMNSNIENTLQIGAIGEDKDIRRLAIPIFSEFVSTLPTVVRTISPIQLSVVDGITALTTENRSLQSAYKIPVSVDFAIGKSTYRLTSEYICSVTTTKGVVVTENLVPSLGLKLVGTTPYEAYLYSDSTKQYYRYTGGTSLESIDTVERFKELLQGRYNFIEQSVVAQFTDRQTTDDKVLVNLKNGNFSNNVFKAINTIYNESGYRIYSLPCGLLLQGPNRCIINRYFYNDYMLNDIKNNIGKWAKVNREKYSVNREYAESFKHVEEQLTSDKMIKGWTYNPFSLVVSPLGVAQETDCMFEWEITFCWTLEMDKIYGDKYAIVNIAAETYEEGGIVKTERPTHIYLTKELFSRSGCYGYYSFRYQSKCGVGNREKLMIWSDQYIAVSGVQCEYAAITNKRQSQLTQQVDVQMLEEL